MASLGPFNLAEPPYRKSGVALVLDEVSPLTETVNLSPDWEVNIVSDKPYIVANTDSDLDRETVFHEGHEAIQDSLDILSFDNDADLVCTDISDEHLLWWVNNDNQHLRIVENAGIPISYSANATVIDADGNVQNSSSPPTEWHEAMRYFRLAQVTDDLFDAYRNIYLSFERILSHIEPKQNEGEREWLDRVLGGHLPSDIDLTDFTRGNTNPVDDFIQEQYDIRNKIFHAKEGQSRLRPQNPNDQETVKTSLQDLTGFVIELIRESTVTNRSGGMIYEAGFDSMTGWVEEYDLEFLTNNRYPPLVVSADYDPDTSEPFLKSLLGKVNLERSNQTFANLRNWYRTSKLYSWGKPQRYLESFALIKCGEDQPLITLSLREPLYLENISVLELQLGLYLIDTGLPRYQFPR